jgi:HAD superfamily hydrolase (TIGR01549 family)
LDLAQHSLDKNGSTPKWVFFDFDGTVRHNEPNGLNTFHQFVEQQGIELTEVAQRQAKRWNHLYWADSPMLKEDVELAGEELEQLYLRYTRRYLEQLGVDPEQLDELTATMQQMMSDHYQPEDYVPAEVHETLQFLKESGYSLALISNRRQPYQDKVHEIGLADYFEFTLAAGEIGRWKPDPALLQHAAERAGAEPSQTIYVGDNPYADVAGADAAGMEPVLIDPEGLFPDVDCQVIASLDQLLPLLSLPVGS